MSPGSLKKKRKGESSNTSSSKSCKNIQIQVRAASPNAHSHHRLMHEYSNRGEPKSNRILKMKGQSLDLSREDSSAISRRRSKSTHDSESKRPGNLRKESSCTCMKQPEQLSNGQESKEERRKHVSPRDSSPSDLSPRSAHNRSARNSSESSSREKIAMNDSTGSGFRFHASSSHSRRNFQNGLDSAAESFKLGSTDSPRRFTPSEVPVAMLKSKHLLPKDELQCSEENESLSSDSISRASPRTSHRDEERNKKTKRSRKHAHLDASSSSASSFGNVALSGSVRLRDHQSYQQGPNLIRSTIKITNEEHAAKYVKSPDSKKKKEVDFELPPALGMNLRSSPTKLSEKDVEKKKGVVPYFPPSINPSANLTDDQRLQSPSSVFREEKEPVAFHSSDTALQNLASHEKRSFLATQEAELQASQELSTVRESEVRMRNRDPSPVSTLVRQGIVRDSSERLDALSVEMTRSSEIATSGEITASNTNGLSDRPGADESDKEDLTQITFHASKESEMVSEHTPPLDGQAPSVVTSAQPTVPNLQMSPFEIVSPVQDRRRLFRETSDVSIAPPSDAPSSQTKLSPISREKSSEIEATRISKSSMRFLSGRLPSPRTQVEEWVQGVAPSLLYARELTQANVPCRIGDLEGAVPCIPVKIISKEEKDFVFGDGAFQVHIVGLKIAQEPAGLSTGLAKLGLGSCPPSTSKHRVLYSTRREHTVGAQTLVPTIHYDSIRRESANQLQREYVHIPSDRGLVTCASGSGTEEVDQLAMQFVLFQVHDDLQSKWCASTLDNVDTLNAELKSLSASQAPYFSLLAPFLKVSGALGDAALDQAGRSDRLIDADFSFRLMSRSPALNQTRGGAVYLRYGYYYILSEPSTAKLYTCLDAGENVRLFTRREKDGQLQSAKKLSYIIIRVSEQASGQGKKNQTMFPPLQQSVGDVEMLRSLLAEAKDCSNDAEFRQRIIELVDKVNLAR